MRSKLSSVLVLLLLSGCMPNYSDGSRIGIVTKLSHKGMLFKSWEGEMLIALPVSVAGTTQPEKFAFNVDDKAVDAVEKAMKMSPEPFPEVEPVRARPIVARRARRLSWSGNSGASVATTMMIEPTSPSLSPPLPS